MRRIARSLFRLAAGAVLTTGLLALFFAPAFGQSYLFSIDQAVVDVFWESDGSARIVYQYVISNLPSGAVIEFIDIGTPNENYDISTISATINGQPIGHIAQSEYIDVGIELGLGSQSIPPGETANVMVDIGSVTGVLYEDSEEDEYASARFSPNWFDADLVSGTTDLSVRFHLPPDVQPDEPRWHASPAGWPTDRPSANLDSQGRVQYSWNNPGANAYTQYEFGASFPAQYVPAGSIRTAPAFTIDTELLFGLCCFGGLLIGIGGFIALGVWQSRRRKLDYLPPKLAIEGHGIKRGLTAVEAAVLLETPLDKVLTMILFSVIKKGAAKVVTEDPLKVERMDSEVKLRGYESEFLDAIVDGPSNKRRSALQDVMVHLVKSVQKKMKGFSLKESRQYYRTIMEKAWDQINDAETPEVKSERYADALEWTMLDRNFDDRTQEVFRTGPVHLPPWWYYYRPSTPGSAPAGTKLGAPSSGGRTISMPTLPGSDFAASIVNGVQNTASNLVTNVVGFTNGVTKSTNPPPPPSKSSGRSFSSGGGGCACACACACAGCACACAGGGR